MSGWKTQKGDEWRYENGVMVANGNLYSPNDLLVVRDIASTKGDVSEKLLFSFLRDTKDSFPEVSIFIKQSRLGGGVEEALTLLENKELVKTKLSASSEALIQVVSVQAKRRLLSW